MLITHVPSECIQSQDWLFLTPQKRAAAGQRSPSLWRVYWRTYWPLIVVGGVYKVLADQLIYVPPVCLDYMVNYVLRQTEAETEGAVADKALNETTANVSDVRLETLFPHVLQKILHS